ncbi:MAG: YfcE family phosphodiesterase, partial [Planctomycetes bacterium]|nr:YfcE family phosphodiesterase [Planctomycetota bacterium]
MKLGILSDSHDNLPFIAKALALFEREGVDCLVHAGDYVAPFAMRALLKFKGRVLGVFGNNDGEKVGLKKLCPVLVEP